MRRANGDSELVCVVAIVTSQGVLSMRVLACGSHSNTVPEHSVTSTPQSMRSCSRSLAATSAGMTGWLR